MFTAPIKAKTKQKNFGKSWAQSVLHLTNSLSVCALTPGVSRGNRCSGLELEKRKKLTEKQIFLVHLDSWRFYRVGPGNSSYETVRSFWNNLRGHIDRLLSITATVAGKWGKCSHDLHSKNCKFDALMLKRNGLKHSGNRIKARETKSPSKDIGVIRKRTWGQGLITGRQAGIHSLPPPPSSSLSISVSTNFLQKLERKTSCCGKRRECGRAGHAENGTEQQTFGWYEERW